MHVLADSYQWHGSLCTARRIWGDLRASVPEGGRCGRRAFPVQEWHVDRQLHTGGPRPSDCEGVRVPTSMVFRRIYVRAVLLQSRPETSRRLVFRR